MIKSAVMNVQQLFAATVVQLQVDHIDNPASEARLLICKVLGLDHAGFIAAQYGYDVLKEQTTEIGRLVEQRIAGQSIAVLIGERAFYDQVMCVTPDVLVPRPETEILIDTVFAHLSVEQPCRILDIGTGSGAVAITLAASLPLVKVTAIDISVNALEVARLNADRSGIDPLRIEFMQCDILHEIPHGEFEMVVSNPPYIPGYEVEQIIAKKLVADPRLALDGGRDGLDFYRRLVEIIPDLLKPKGWLILEHGARQRKAVADLFDDHKLFELTGYNDLSGLDRGVAVFYKGNGYD